LGGKKDMKKNMLKKTLVVGIIFLFIGVGVYPAVAVKLNTPINIIQGKEFKEMKETEPSGLFWGTYTNCTIDGWHYGMYPQSVDRFALVIWNGPPFESCILDGFKGKRAVNWIIGFGFVGIIDEYTILREEERIFGRLLFCIYLVDWNPAKKPYDVTTTQECDIG